MDNGAVTLYNGFTYWRTTMPIPRLSSAGLLPPGEHHATIDEIVGAFPPISAERQALNDALRGTLIAFQALKDAEPSSVIYIDGSYTTSKRDPVDIDVLVLSVLFDEDQIIDLLDRTCPIEATYLDIHVDRPETPALLTLFTHTRRGTLKGIIVLDF